MERVSKCNSLRVFTDKKYANNTLDYHNSCACTHWHCRDVLSHYSQKQLTLGQVELTIPLTSKGKGVISNVISRYCNFIVLH